MILSFSRDIRYFKLFKKFFSGYQVLGIESSCDDTSAAVVNTEKKILGKGHFSQSKIHVETGGVLTHVAHYFHLNNLKDAVESAMKQSSLDFQDLNAIAVTVKPGLVLSLKAGIEFAKNLCKLHNKPLIPIHHMEAHALTGRLIEDVEFPFLALLISGGHSILSYVESATKFYTLGKDKGTSPGQALDRVARRAKLNTLKEYRGMVGGAAIETAAISGHPTAYELFYKMIYREKSCNFNFSGITSKAIQILQKQEKIQSVEPDGVIFGINDFCAAFQLELTKYLCQRVELAFIFLNHKELLTQNKCLVVSGGVASNQFIRAGLKLLCDNYDYRLVVPPSQLCTDNGAMIAWNGLEKLNVDFPVLNPTELDCITPLPKCPLGEDISNEVENFSKFFTNKTLTFNKLFKNFYEGKEKICH